MLGVRSLWHTGGRPAAEEAFKHFWNLVAASLKGETSEAIPQGILESDAAVLMCQSASVAARVCQKLYRIAFEKSKIADDDRIWLRGAIIPAPQLTALRSETSFSGPLNQIKIFEYADELLDAIAVEKSGIKGMRIIIDDSLITSSLITEFRIPVGELFFIPFRHLTNSTYPGRLKNGFQDYLWMASRSEEEWTHYSILMASRLRWAAQNDEEFLQAAATQVVFHECAAIFTSLVKRTGA